MTDFKGVVAAIFTPFDDDDRVDLAYMRDHIRFIEEHGAHGIVASGTNGEFWAMSTEERKAVFETCAAARGGLFMVAGTGAGSLTETIELTQFAESAGADAVMVVPPYFFHMATEEGLIDYYKRVFDSVSLPIFLYNIPQCSGIRITDSIIQALEHYPHLAGVKDSSGQLPSTLHYIEAFPKLRVFVGDDHQVLSALTAGAVGHITGHARRLPEPHGRCLQSLHSGPRRLRAADSTLDGAQDILVVLRVRREQVRNEPARVPAPPLPPAARGPDRRAEGPV